VAMFTITDAYISINGVTLSDHAKSVTCEDTRDQVDFTAFGATSKVYGKGLGDAKITVEFSRTSLPPRSTRPCSRSSRPPRHSRSRCARPAGLVPRRTRPS
jgi:hypothetical protein